MVYDEEIQDFVWMSEPLEGEDVDAYLPFGLFATAYARAKLLENVKACIDEYGCESIIHSDTDSVIHYGPPVDRVPHGEHLGTWGIESEPEIIIEGGFKRYIELHHYPMRSFDDFIGSAIAGVPQKKDHNGVPIGMWVEILDEPKIIEKTGYILGQEHYRIESPWLREMYTEHGMDPDDVDTRKLIPVRVQGGTILEPRQHCLNDNMIWRLHR